MASERDRPGPGRRCRLPDTEGRRGGVSAPNPVSYDLRKVPQKGEESGPTHGLTDKLQSDQLIVVDALALAGDQDQAFVGCMKHFDVRKLLIVTEAETGDLDKSSRNVPWVKVMRREGLNVYDMLNYDHLFLEQSAIGKNTGGTGFIVDIYHVIKEPHITEKANLQKESINQVTFKVDRRANKIEIRQAVETLFKTKVLDVKTMTVCGKQRRIGKNVGRRPDWKKAIVQLAPGENIEFFEGV